MYISVYQYMYTVNNLYNTNIILIKIQSSGLKQTVGTRISFLVKLIQQWLFYMVTAF